MKEPKAFNSAEVVAILNGASAVQGDDFPRAFRIMREIKGLPEYKMDPKAGPSILIKDEIFLHLKPVDLPCIWKWIKAFYFRADRVTPVVLEGMAELADKLGQSDDYAAVVAEMTDEGEEEESKADAETTTI